MNGTQYYPQHNNDPMIYAFTTTDPRCSGLIRIGVTSDDIDRTVASEYPVRRPDGSLPYRIVFRSSARRKDGTVITESDIRSILSDRYVSGLGGNWFKCTADELKDAVRNLTI